MGGKENKQDGNEIVWEEYEEGSEGDSGIFGEGDIDGGEEYIEEDDGLEEVEEEVEIEVGKMIGENEVKKVEEKQIAIVLSRMLIFFIVLVMVMIPYLRMLLGMVNNSIEDLVAEQVGSMVGTVNDISYTLLGKNGDYMAVNLPSILPWTAIKKIKVIDEEGEEVEYKLGIWTKYYGSSIPDIGYDIQVASKDTGKVRRADAVSWNIHIEKKLVKNESEYAEGFSEDTDNNKKREGREK